MLQKNAQGDSKPGLPKLSDQRGTIRTQPVCLGRDSSLIDVVLNRVEQRTPRYARIYHFERFVERGDFRKRNSTHRSEHLHQDAKPELELGGYSHVI